MKSIIVDLDGTLCDSAHRDHLAMAGLWEEFHSGLTDDKVHKDVAEVITIMSDAGYLIIGLTGRNEKFRYKTLGWLGLNKISLDHLIMRPDNNYQSDYTLKPRMLADQFGSQESALNNVLMILEDRDKVVEAWRNLGYRCWQVQPGGY
jgi:hypothetical protein